MRQEVATTAIANALSRVFETADETETLKQIALFAERPTPVVISTNARQQDEPAARRLRPKWLGKQ